MKYGSGGDAVVITAGSDGPDRVLISVEDRGGLPLPADIDRLTEPFYRGDRGRATTEGSGLGLAIVRGIVGSFGGTFRLEPGRHGLRAVITLRSAV
jgi:signal transduction histidine kinase